MILNRCMNHMIGSERTDLQHRLGTPILFDRADHPQLVQLAQLTLICPAISVSSLSGALHRHLLLSLRHSLPSRSTPEPDLRTQPVFVSSRHRTQPLLDPTFPLRPPLPRSFTDPASSFLRLANTNPEFFRRIIENNILDIAISTAVNSIRVVARTTVCLAFLGCAAQRDCRREDGSDTKQRRVQLNQGISSHFPHSLHRARTGCRLPVSVFSPGIHHTPLPHHSLSCPSSIIQPTPPLSLRPLAHFSPSSTLPSPNRPPLLPLVISLITLTPSPHHPLPTSLSPASPNRPLASPNRHSRPLLPNRHLARFSPVVLLLPVLGIILSSSFTLARFSPIVTLARFSPIVLSSFSQSSSHPHLRILSVSIVLSPQSSSPASPQSSLARISPIVTLARFSSPSSRPLLPNRHSRPLLPNRHSRPLLPNRHSRPLLPNRHSPASPQSSLSPASPQSSLSPASPRIITLARFSPIVTLARFSPIVTLARISRIITLAHISPIVTLARFSPIVTLARFSPIVTLARFSPIVTLARFSPIVTLARFSPIVTRPLLPNRHSRPLLPNRHSRPLLPNRHSRPLLPNRHSPASPQSSLSPASPQSSLSPASPQSSLSPASPDRHSRPHLQLSSPT
ncbi:hypothetical protein BLNAU_13767 [Blattamonas nauphoetae]|uniref:Uncharacterized protein n=1 Tax=Blattamonas nauphoetae TaxID=2049346 RepID=A0ABQ9XMB1_9EUKA|nr:hypothetical protein BLNAU_13767 [Blattamonas nauphoetae]